MLFNSYVFLFAFLPAVLVLFFVVARISHGWAAGLLAAASIIFYSWWSWRFTPILLTSIVFNYVTARTILKHRAAGRAGRARAWLILGITADLLALGYFKYMNFFVEVARQAGAGVDWQAVILPVGISFFTFTQIAFLVDTFQGKVAEVRPVHYLLFVTYFPHLIAGPILHHAEMMPQFRKERTYRPNAEALSVGLTILIFGLIKKVFIADRLGGIADFAFEAEHVPGLNTPQAWQAVLAYTLQIYFDFSAYCDMAIGVSRMLNITLPANFESPYKSLSITEFWRRWHMTLSRFLRDYLYIPLGGNRHGPVRRYANLMATMVLGGFWHGAGWNFLIWGGLHGLYLCVNHAWNALTSRSGWRLPVVVSWTLTFGAVMLAWVFFRAPDLGTANGMLWAMAGLGTTADTLQHAAAQGTGGVLRWLAVEPQQAVWLAFCLGLALAMPNVRQIMGRHEVVLGAVREPDKRSWPPLTIRWTPNAAWATVAVALFCLSLARMNRVSQFLYFQF